MIGHKDNEARDGTEKKIIRLHKPFETRALIHKNALSVGHGSGQILSVKTNTTLMGCVLMSTGFVFRFGGLQETIIRKS